MAEVYWIHLPEHTDMFKSGYIGITTKTYQKRFKGHQYSVAEGSTLKVHNAMRKYADRIVVSKVCDGDLEFCLFVEQELRPSAQMPGVWNIGSGGVCPTVGYTHSDETRAKLVTAWKTRLPPNAETMLKRSLAKTGRCGWKNNAACLPAWAVAIEFKEMLDSGLRYSVIYDTIGLTRSNFSKVKKKIDTGWNPHEDEEYLLWRDSYLQQQKEANGT